MILEDLFTINNIGAELRTSHNIGGVLLARCSMRVYASAVSASTHAECAPNEITLLYSANLQRGAVAAMRLPFPEGLDPDLEIALELTLTYTSAVDPSDASE